MAQRGAGGAKQTQSAHCLHLATKPRRARSGRAGEWRQAGLNRQRQAHGHLRTGFEWLESHRERFT